uniref:Uncharacterized protein n=1 Tax=viral metagenome TaxID=1070528 RepID=A0A6M3J0X6_9ZZZZ
MTEGAWKLGKGHYQLHEFRFPYDPEHPSDSHLGIDFDPSEVEIETMTGTVTQFWTPVYGDTPHDFKWETMDEEFWTALKTLFDVKFTAPATTYTFYIFNNRTDTVASSWNVTIKDLKGKKDKGVMKDVTLRLKFNSKLS